MSENNGGYGVMATLEFVALPIRVQFPLATLMSILRKKIFENLTLFMLVLFTLISILGINTSMKIKDGQMSFCSFMDRQEAMCQMSAVEHIALWQKAFIGIPSKNDFFALAILSLIIIIIPFIKLFSQLKKLIAFAAQLSARRKACLVIKVFNPLLLAFSDGILNPKIH